MKLQEILMESLAQGYCVEPNLNKVLDANLIESQVKLALEKINKKDRLDLKYENN